MPHHAAAVGVENLGWKRGQEPSGTSRGKQLAKGLMRQEAGERPRGTSRLGQS